MMLEKKKDVRKTFISLVAVALFLALVLVLVFSFFWRTCRFFFVLSAA